MSRNKRMTRKQKQALTQHQQPSGVSRYAAKLDKRKELAREQGIYGAVPPLPVLTAPEVPVPLPPMEEPEGLPADAPTAIVTVHEHPAPLFRRLFGGGNG